MDNITLWQHGWKNQADCATHASCVLFAVLTHTIYCYSTDVINEKLTGL